MAILLFDWGGTSIKYGVWQQGELKDTASVETPDSWEEMKIGYWNFINSFSRATPLMGSQLVLLGAWIRRAGSLAA